MGFEFGPSDTTSVVRVKSAAAKETTSRRSKTVVKMQDEFCQGLTRKSRYSFTWPFAIPKTRQ